MAIIYLSAHIYDVKIKQVDKGKKMTFNDLVAEVFMFEAEQGHNSLLLLDIDDTLVRAQNIYIYRKLPTDEKEVKLTPEEYAKEQINAKTKEFYDYRDFRDPKAVAKSIKTGIPIIPNLKIMDDYIKNGWTIGLLTARGMEEVVANTMKVWLKYTSNKNDLKKIGDKLARELVMAVNDDTKHYKGSSDFEKKANVIKELSKKYDRIMLIDDDIKNLKAAKDLGIKNVYTKLAQKPKD